MIDIMSQFLYAILIERETLSIKTCV